MCAFHWVLSSFFFQVCLIAPLEVPRKWRKKFSKVRISVQCWIRLPELTSSSELNTWLFLRSHLVSLSPGIPCPFVIWPVTLGLFSSVSFFYFLPPFLEVFFKFFSFPHLIFRNGFVTTPGWFLSFVLVIQAPLLRDLGKLHLPTWNLHLSHLLYQK